MAQPMLIDKIGMLIWQDCTFLVVRKYKTTKFLMPGGKREQGETDEIALKREIREELGVEVKGQLVFVGEFLDEAANDPGALVRIRLYEGQIQGEPQPSSEIEEILWFDLQSGGQEEILSAIIRNRILPFLRNKRKCNS